ncbi:MAG: hypothetical protein V4454_10510 [Pseudomonadota bacterium]
MSAVDAKFNVYIKNLTYTAQSTDLGAASGLLKPKSRESWLKMPFFRHQIGIQINKDGRG